MSDLVRDLFQFQKDAHRLIQELRALPCQMTEEELRQVFHLQDALSFIAPKAAYVGSIISVAIRGEEAA
jgi:hypothetical protein